MCFFHHKNDWFMTAGIDIVWIIKKIKLSDIFLYDIFTKVWRNSIAILGPATRHFRGYWLKPPSWMSLTCMKWYLGAMAATEESIFLLIMVKPLPSIEMSIMTSATARLQGALFILISWYLSCQTQHWSYSTVERMALFLWWSYACKWWHLSAICHCNVGHCRPVMSKSMVEDGTRSISGLSNSVCNCVSLAAAMRVRKSVCRQETQAQSSYFSIHVLL